MLVSTFAPVNYNLQTPKSKEAESRLKSSFLGAEWVMLSLKRSIISSMLLRMSSILSCMWETLVDVFSKDIYFLLLKEVGKILILEWLQIFRQEMPNIGHILLVLKWPITLAFVSKIVTNNQIYVY